GGPLGLGPLAQVLAVGAEDLDAVGLAIAHPHAPVGRASDAVRQPELARAVAGLAPRALELPGRRKDVHARIAVAVRDVEIALGTYGDVGRPVERARPPLDGAGVLAVVAGVRRRIENPHGHEELSLRRELAHRVIAVVGAEDRAVRRDVDA